MHRNITVGGLAVALALVTGIPAAAEPAEVSVIVAGGLDAPRGIAFGPDGTLYVAEAGEGGEGACAEHVEMGQTCFAATGGISVVVDGEVTRIIDALPSGLGQTGVTGASDVVVDDQGTLWFTVGLGASSEWRDSIPGDYGQDMGFLYRVDETGIHEKVADLVAWEAANNPDADQPANGEPDSNPNGIALSEDGVLVADAGGNSLVTVAPDGSVSLEAVFPVAMTPFQLNPESEEQLIPVDPVPTSVAVGPDGAYYVGMLTGFPFIPGSATVDRVVPGQAPTVYAKGFTNVMDVAFAPDGTLYVLEIAHEGLASVVEGPPTGGLWAVPAGGGEARLIVTEGLVMPGGMAVSDDGSVFISTCSVCPDGGGIIRVQP